MVNGYELTPAASRTEHASRSSWNRLGCGVRGGAPLPRSGLRVPTWARSLSWWARSGGIERPARLRIGRAARAREGPSAQPTARAPVRPRRARG